MEDHARSADEQRTHTGNMESEQQELYSAGNHDSDFSSLTQAQARSLLSHTSLSGRGNGAPRAAAALRAQQTYGNRAVQRCIQRQVAVQRDPDPAELLRMRRRPAPTSGSVPLSAADLMHAPQNLTPADLDRAGVSLNSPSQSEENASESESEGPQVRVPVGNRAVATLDPSGANLRVGTDRVNMTGSYNPVDGAASVGVAGTTPRRRDGAVGTPWNASLNTNTRNPSIGATVGVGRWSGTGNINFADPSSESAQGPVSGISTGVTYRPRNMPAITGTAGLDLARREGIQGTLGFSIGGATPSLDDANSATTPGAAAVAGAGLVQGISEANEQNQTQPEPERPAPAHPGGVRPASAEEVARDRRERVREAARQRSLPAELLRNMNAGANITINEEGVAGLGVTAGTRF